ncbi:hypothetical protein ABB55_24260 [Prosthecomicrobium hirschii]|uniref:Uncharacterized protein n=1 Tax=Prosthecodimorpha hirschii TaxID=665126 RepID=A0A0P6VTQ8_9HYPH|nr:hypothetical protein [Prosthecomicrobium hirschii]KPL54956.1 hypothetical protein ABB55_24260 [Prosthecomicrobium hirschii]TPQ50028.1 hypothetical protein C2U72_15440 [Prosthecomicrobium hirschii]
MTSMPRRLGSSLLAVLGLALVPTFAAAQSGLKPDSQVAPPPPPKPAATGLAAPKPVNPAPKPAPAVSTVALGPAERALAAWKGRKGDDLIVFWGAPTSIQPLSGGARMMVFTFKKEQAGVDLGQAAKLFGFQKASGLLSQIDTSSRTSCVVNIKVSGRGLIEFGTVMENAGPQGEEVCSKLLRPPA